MARSSGHALAGPSGLQGSWCGPGAAQRLRERNTRAPQRRTATEYGGCTSFAISVFGMLRKAGGSLCSWRPRSPLRKGAP